MALQRSYPNPLRRFQEDADVVAPFIKSLTAQRPESPPQELLVTNRWTGRISDVEPLNRDSLGRGSTVLEVIASAACVGRQSIGHMIQDQADAL